MKHENGQLAERFADPVVAERGGNNPVFSLAGKLALITGGGSGIGFEMVRCMVEAGATVVITGRREQPLRDAVATLNHDPRLLTFK